MSQDKLPLATPAFTSGVDVKTARKCLKTRKLPSQMKGSRDWRTRKDPFEDVWPEVEAFLNDSPGLPALTIFQDLHRRNPGKLLDGQLRTLQRHIWVWRGLYGLGWGRKPFLRKRIRFSGTNL